MCVLDKADISALAALPVASRTRLLCALFFPSPDKRNYRNVENWLSPQKRAAVSGERSPTGMVGASKVEELLAPSPF
jgi:hypothetical protein